jgi:hypothetical protein
MGAQKSRSKGARAGAAEEGAGAAGGVA